MKDTIEEGHYKGKVWPAVVLIAYHLTDNRGWPYVCWSFYDPSDTNAKEQARREALHHIKQEERRR